MKKLELNKATLLLIAANLFPVFGVWFLGWSATEAFIVYALETLIIGILTVLKMLISTFAKKNDDWQSNNGNYKKSGLFFILFFIIHFGIFALVQTTIFSQVANITPPNSGMTHFFFHWYSYVNENIAYMLFAFLISYIAKSFIPFILNGEYKTMPMMFIMFQPYGRVLIQQFTVIIGSMFLSFNLGNIFILVFALVKIMFELSFNYEEKLKKSLGDFEKKLSK